MIPAVPDFGLGPAPVPGRLDRLAPDLHRLTAPNPGLMTGPGTNTYLIGTAELAVIDPGPDDATHRAAILDAASTLGTIRWVLVTHTHRDHAPGAAALARACGATVIGFAPAEGFTPDVCAGDGWTLALPDGAGVSISIEAVHTPGHASDHLCWRLAARGMLLTGDHVMHGSTVVIRPPDGDLDQYMASLARVRDLAGVDTLAPGHGRLMQPVAAVIDALLDHRQARHGRVAAALAARGEATVDQLLPLVYDDVTEAQLPVARYSLWAHLRSLAAARRAEPVSAEPGRDTLETRWRALG